MKIGYARVSTTDQDLGRQIDALKSAGCEMIFEEKVSGMKDSRPEFNKMMDTIKEGDVLVVQKLDRLGRSTVHLIKLLNELNARGVKFVSLSENIDTTTAFGELYFTLLAALAQFERSTIVERVNHGLAYARSQGRVGGRPKADVGLILCLYERGQTISQIAKELNISTRTVSRNIPVDYKAN